MRQVIAENKAGQRLDLKASPYHQLISVTGITPPGADVSLSNLATKDGSVFNSSRLNNRNVVLTILPIVKVEQARLDLYRVFKTKQWVRLYLTSASRSVYVDGWVETMDGDLYENSQRIQISILCPDPYLKALEPVTVNFENGAATVDNDSDEAVGFVTELSFAGAASGITVANATTGKSFAVDYEFQQNDKMILNTQRGEKGVWLERSGAKTNIINHMEINSSWIMLQAGQNALTVTATAGGSNLSGTATVQPIYEGV